MSPASIHFGIFQSTWPASQYHLTLKLRTSTLPHPLDMREWEFLPFLAFLSIAPSQYQGSITLFCFHPTVDPFFFLIAV